MQGETIKPYKYQAFGLNVQSEFEIPEFLESSFKQPQVTVRFAEVPEHLENPEKKGLRYQLKDNDFLLRLNNIAHYYVQNGTTVSVQKVENSTMQEVRLFMTGLIFSALLQQRGVFALHGSAVMKGDRSFLICGNSGAGKSTLTREFLHDGYKLLSDDISVIQDEEDTLYVQPSFPFIKLWKDSMDHLEIDEFSGAKLREQMDKYGFNLHEEFYSERLPVNNIFVLVPHNKPEYKREQLKGIEKFNTLKNHTYRFQFMSDNVRQSHFELINKIASQVPVHRVTRPQAPINTGDLKRVIEELME
jgi:hypothetical protein